jgi:hypothetical protein
MYHLYLAIDSGARPEGSGSDPIGQQSDSLVACNLLDIPVQVDRILPLRHLSRLGPVA